MTTRDDLQLLLHNEIPLTKLMGISVKECSPDKVILTAPLDANSNHKDTAFGGSLYSVAVLCGWSLVHCQLQHLGLKGHIVIHHSEVDYRLPVDGTIEAICVVDDDLLFETFARRYRRKQIARIKLRVLIRYQDRDAVIFHGQYVVHH